MNTMEYQFEDYVQQAWDQVEAWNLPQEEFLQAVNDQAKLMAGIPLDFQDADLKFRLHATLRF